MKHRVHAEPRSQSTPPRQPRHRGHFSELKRKTLKFWHHGQIGHRSEYSVERLLAFRDYHERVSLLRVVAVCFFTPIPILSVTLAIDCIPLVPPSDGWKANYALWIRLWLAMFFVAVGFVLQAKQVIIADTISNSGGFVIAVGTATAYVTVSIAVATSIFPIPFGYVLMVGPYLLIVSILTVLVIGRTTIASSSILQKQLKSQLMILAAQGIVAVAYPAFSATFNQLSGAHQTVFVFVLPIIKFVSKQLIAKTAECLHEYVGPIVVFSVDVFNVFYVVICMQAATSPITTVIIVCSDSFHVLLALRDIFQHSDAARVQPNSDLTEDGPSQGQTNFLRDLPAALATAFRGSETSLSHTRRVRVRAPFPLPLSDESWTILQGLTSVENSPVAQNEAEFVEKPHRNATSKTESQSRRIQLKPKSKSPTSLSIVPTLQLVRVTPARQIAEADTLEERWKQTQHQPHHIAQPMSAEAVQDALQTLFHSEYVLMAEYIEFMLPMLYAAYLAAIFHLPVAAYYPHTRSMTEQKLNSTVASILLFSAIEFAAFVVLLVILKRKFGFSPLYQLAFVLETQYGSVQGHLFVWNLYILHLTLVHYGVDFNAPFK